MVMALELRRLVSEGEPIWIFGVEFGVEFWRGRFQENYTLGKIKGSSVEALSYPLLGYLGGMTQIRYRLAFPVVA